ncbi:AAA family ATPase [Sphingobacterium spiritivorum]|uniref:AAA family ATPase n=1 Tax=Sphingobacterium spiritivorum TaxID=258 RepID=UPI003DA3DCFF
MIKIEKQRPPNSLNTEIVYLAIEKMTDFFASKNRSQKRYNWPFNKEIDYGLKGQLYEVFHGKCGYCETKIEFPDLGTIDRYRPSSGVRDKNEYYQDLYWWLTFEWNNLIFCCKECNQYKGNYFPIAGERAKNIKSDLGLEKEMLLNPYEDDPNQHLDYGELGEIVPLTEKGFQTIELLRLNRSDLINKRIQVKREIDELIDIVLDSSRKEKIEYIVEDLKDLYHGEALSSGFSAYKKWILETEIDSNPFFASLLDIEIVDIDDSNGFDDVEKATKFLKENISIPIVNNDYFPIEYIHIKNFKSIDNLRIDFKEDDINKKSWLFLLGENGVGKSSILQAIAIGLKLDKKLINEEMIRSLIKKRKQTSEITIKERNSENIIKTTLVRKTNSFEQTGNFKSYLIGYGSLRLSVDEIENNSKRDTSKISYQNLFKPTNALNDVSKWLRYIYNNDNDFLIVLLIL